MSGDIPVGSPPAPPGRHAAPGGWYPDPVDRSRERYWDGWQWSRNTRPAEVPPAPAGASGPAAPPFPATPPLPGASPSQPGQPALGRQGSGPPTGSGPRLLTADGVEVSGWWLRVLAVIIDAIVVGLITILLSIPIYLRMMPAMSAIFEESMRAAERGEIMPMIDPNRIMTPDDQLQLSLIALGVGLLYHGVFLRLRAATPGKLICGLRVVPVDQGRATAPLTWRSTIVRTLIWVLPGTLVWLLIFQLIDVLLPLGHPKRQAVHDLAAGTQVVKKRR